MTPLLSRFSALQRAENSSIPATQDIQRRLQIRFQCSSASRKFLNSPAARSAIFAQMFQCSSASRKFLNRTAPAAPDRRTDVSVLFSEPKIPQSVNRALERSKQRGFSALQRAENSSIEGDGKRPDAHRGFSALQRAENSSMFDFLDLLYGDAPFQCSSASRKFLNYGTSAHRLAHNQFQCSSASRKFLN